ncbi:MAG: hypothetical protein AAGC64_05885 [Bacteroidota bacterium]
MFSEEGVPKRRLLLVLLVIAGFLVFSKLFVASFILVFSYKFFLRKPYIIPVFFMTIFLFFLSFYLYRTLGKLHGSFSHFFGYFTGIILIKDIPFGFGLGMAGNRGLLDHEIHMGEFGGESGLGNIIAQFGFLGFVLLTILFLIMIEFRKRYKLSPSYLGLFVAFSAYLLNFYLSAASLGMSGNIMFFIVGGMFLNPRMTITSHVQ